MELRVAHAPEPVETRAGDNHRTKVPAPRSPGIPGSVLRIAVGARDDLDQVARLSRCRGNDRYPYTAHGAQVLADDGVLKRSSCLAGEGIYA